VEARGRIIRRISLNLFSILCFEILFASMTLRPFFLAPFARPGRAFGTNSIFNFSLLGFSFSWRVVRKAFIGRVATVGSMSFAEECIAFG